MNILRRVPNSVLWLVADTPLVRENLFRYAEQPASIRTPDLRHARLPADYLARYQHGRPVPRHLPVQRRHHRQRRAVGRPAAADLRRPTFASRMAGSLLRAVDLPQLITTTFADYEELAVALANDPHASPR
jgi:hypothetical protein